jgi:hypothetical protein
VRVVRSTRADHTVGHRGRQAAFDEIAACGDLLGGCLGVNDWQVGG